MGKPKSKVDIIAASKTKKYRIGMFSVIGLGVVLMVVGILLYSMVTPTLSPRGLTVRMSGLVPVGNTYTKNISVDEFMIIDTGRSHSAALTSPIVFSWENGSGEDVLLEIPEARWTGGLVELKVNPLANSGDWGTLTISLAGQPTINIKLTKITTYFA